jgi:hypothetical protein
VKDNPKPDSVWSAIHAMTEEDWNGMCEDCFPGIEPEYVTPESVIDMVRETDTCSSLSSPVEVWIDSEGYHRILVY